MSTFSAPKGVLEYYPPVSAAFLAVRETLMGQAEPRRLRLHRTADLRGHRPVRAWCRRVDRRGQQGDVHLHRPRRPLDHTAPGRHRGRDPVDHRTRHGPRPAPGQTAPTPARSSATRRPQAGRYRQFNQFGVEAIGSRRPRAGCRGHRGRGRRLPGRRPDRLPTGADVARRRRAAARPTAPSSSGVPGRPAAGRGHPAARRAEPAAGAGRQAARGARGCWPTRR